MYKNKKIIALIQVRLSSSRLPNKALIDICGKKSIERVLEQIKKSKFVDDIVVATSDEECNLPLISFLKQKNINYFAGDLLNIVKRFIDAATPFKPSDIVRVCGDSPLISFEMIDFIIESHLLTNSDYTSSEYGLLPTGVMSEIINFNALKKLYSFDMDFSYSEYLTYYFRNNPTNFKINLINIPAEYNHPEYRLTLDYPEDLELIKCIYSNLLKSKAEISLINILNFLKNNSELTQVNSNRSLIFQTNEELIKKLNIVTRINK
jgi:spore coat polysaccharide biosynthesis protein SpsF (cytidylyltransferase family)